MPITQDRMLALINAADACYSNMRDLQRRLGELAEDVLIGRLSESDAFNEFVSFSARIQVPPDALVTLGRERERFNHANQHVNRRRAARARRKRSAGAAPQDQGTRPSPDSGALAPEIEPATNVLDDLGDAFGTEEIFLGDLASPDTVDGPLATEDAAPGGDRPGGDA